MKLTGIGEELTEGGDRMRAMGPVSAFWKPNSQLSGCTLPCILHF